MRLQEGLNSAVSKLTEALNKLQRAIDGQDNYVVVKSNTLKAFCKPSKYN